VKLLSLARDLQRRRARERESYFVVEGVRAVEELLASSLRVRGVLVAPQLAAAPRGAALLEALRNDSKGRDYPIAEISEQEFQGASATESPQGVLAIARIPEHSFDSIKTPSRILVLDGLQDPGNVGTILRTAAALGVSATVALPGTVDLWNAKVVRGAMGAHFRHVAFHASVNALQRYLTEHHIPLWAADSRGEPLDTVRATLPEASRLAIAVGNEGAGLSPEVSMFAARTVALPIDGVESLNVAVATGIILYELRA
jgi:TrmH family RNA methyltransferase